jgi:DNA invertase Pin-like site-specific DNA recombinase
MNEPHKGRWIAYYRVSTARQGRSGLGLDAQRQAVTDFLNGGSWKLVGEYTEVESGKNSDRPQLAEALKACRVHRATLVIAKLDRLSRDAHFLLGLQNAGVKFVAADMPEANEMIVGIMAVVAQAERKMISRRTKEALAAAKARGVKLGGFRGRAGTAEDCAKATAARQAKAAAQAADLMPTINDVRAELLAGGEKTTLRAIAKKLNERDVKAPRGGEWSAVQVSRVLSS